MSGMDRVEFYLGSVLQKIIKEPRPTYEWVLPNFFHEIKVTIYAVAFDKAGNSAMDYIIVNPCVPWWPQKYFYKNLSPEIVEIKNNKVDEKPPYTVSINNNFDPASIIVVFNREFGENNWINSNASISIFYEADRIDKVYYQLNNQSWILYSKPIVISEDGTHVFSWYVIDSEGYTSTPESIFFKIDKTPPKITLKKEKISINEVKFIAEVADATSGIDKVEFQDNFGFVFTDYEYPYEWVLTKFLTDKITAIVYDKAGNTASKTKSTQSRNTQQYTSSQHIINQLFQNLILNHLIRILNLKRW
jgi:hypothetical protein